MGISAHSDEDLLMADDAASFEVFYVRRVEQLLGYFGRRTADPELAADLTAETFAAALAGRHRYRPAAGPAGAWLYGIAANKLADARRRGHAERRARRRMGMERLDLSDDDVTRIERLSSREASGLVEGLPAEQRQAVTAHVVDERSYQALAGDLHLSEAVLRKRVSRGLAVVRRRMVGRP
jgi:RNA polymerase sigma-70 factor (ECF subfamily)